MKQVTDKVLDYFIEPVQPPQKKILLSQSHVSLQSKQSISIVYVKEILIIIIIINTFIRRFSGNIFGRLLSPRDSNTKSISFIGL